MTVWARSPAGTPSWMKTATWSVNGTSSSRHDSTHHFDQCRTPGGYSLPAVQLGPLDRRAGALSPGGAAHADIRRIPADPDRDHRRGQLLGLRFDPGHPRFHPAQLRRAADLSGHVADISQYFEVRGADLGANARDRVHRCLFRSLPCQIADVADHAVHDLHDPVLDLQHHPYYLVDSISGAQRDSQFDSDGDGGDRS